MAYPSRPIGAAPDWMHGGASLSNAGRKRLGKDMQELEHPPAGISTSLFSDDNMAHWAVNFVFRHGPFEGGILHLHVSFTPNYPLDPPQVRLLSPWTHHSHVYNDKICFSLVKDFETYFKQSRAPASSLWNAAVSLRHFLESLYLFLSTDEDNDHNFTLEGIKQNIANTFTFQCAECIHTGAHPFPPLHTPTLAVPTSSQTHTVSSAHKVAHDAVHPHLIAPDTMTHASPNASEDDIGARKNRYQCYLPQCLAKGPTVQPCFGIRLIRHVDLAVESLQAVGCCICFTCFEEMMTTASQKSAPHAQQAVIRTDMGQEIVAAIPYVVQSDTWPRDRAINALVQALKDYNFWWLYADRSGAKSLEDCILDACGEMWKQHALCLTKMDAQELEYASETFLQSFVTLYHFLKAEEKYNPKIEEVATTSVTSALNCENFRSRQKLPDFGRFLVRFLIAKDSWPSDRDKLANLLRELFARSCHRALLPKSHLHEVFVTDRVVTREEKIDALEGMWQVAKTGLGLTALQATFISLFHDTTLECLDKLCGIPSANEMKKFQDAMKAIQHMLREASFSDGDAPTPCADFFDLVKLDVPRDVDEIFKVVQRGVRDSYSKGYHGRCQVCNQRLSGDQIAHRFCELHRCMSCNSKCHAQGCCVFCRQHAYEYEATHGYLPLFSLPVDYPTTLIASVKKWYQVLTLRNGVLRGHDYAKGSKTTVLGHFEGHVTAMTYKEWSTPVHEQNLIVIEDGHVSLYLMRTSDTLGTRIWSTNKSRWFHVCPQEAPDVYVDIAVHSMGDVFALTTKKHVRVLDKSGIIVRHNVLRTSVQHAEFQPTRICLDEKRHFLWILEQIPMRIQAFGMTSGSLAIVFYVPNDAWQSKFAPSSPWFRNPRHYGCYRFNVWISRQPPTMPADICIIDDSLIVCLRNSDSIRSYSLATLPRSVPARKGGFHFQDYSSPDTFLRIRYCDQTHAWAIRGEGREQEACGFIIFSNDFKATDDTIGSFSSPSRICEAVHIQQRFLNRWGHPWSKSFVCVADTGNNRVIFLALPVVRSTDDMNQATYS